MKILWKSLILCSTLAVLCVFVLQVQAAGDVADGEKCYAKVCMSCHGANPSKMTGQAPDTLSAKLKAFRTKEGLSGKALQMQEVVKKISDKSIDDVAAYLKTL